MLEVKSTPRRRPCVGDEHRCSGCNAARTSSACLASYGEGAVSCIAPTLRHAKQGTAKHVRGLGAAEPLPCSVCARPYCPTRVPWRRRPSPAARAPVRPSLFYFLKPLPNSRHFAAQGCASAGALWVGPLLDRAGPAGPRRPVLRIAWRRQPAHPADVVIASRVAGSAPS